MTIGSLLKWLVLLALPFALIFGLIIGIGDVINSGRAGHCQQMRDVYGAHSAEAREACA